MNCMVSNWNMMSYNWSSMSNMMSNSRSSMNCMMGNMMQGNANVLNADLRAAKRAADSPMGDLLQMAGNVGTSYGLYTGS